MDRGYPPRKPFGRVGRSEKPDRSWGIGESQHKVHSDVIKVIHPESEDYKS